jgi:hypothetical protein
MSWSGVKCRWKRGCFSSHWWIAGVLVRGVVVQHEVQVQVLRDGGVDELEEPQKVPVPVPPAGLCDDRAAGQVEGGEQAGHAVAEVSTMCRLAHRWLHGWPGPLQPPAPPSHGLVV